MRYGETQGHLADLYGADASPDLVGRVTDAVMEQGATGRTARSIWFIQSRSSMPCGSTFAPNAWSRTRPSNLELALHPDGEEDVLGIWIEQSEGQVLAQDRQRDQGARKVNDTPIADAGLKGFPEAITSVFPQTMVQTCIVDVIRNSVAFVSWKDRKAILPALKAVYCMELNGGGQRRRST
jgi:transposase-like protein